MIQKHRIAFMEQMLI